MQEEITRNYYNPETGCTVKRTCPLHEWTPGTFNDSPGIFYPTEYIDETSSSFGNIEGIPVLEDKVILTPYVSIIWYAENSFPRVYGKCCVLPQRLVDKNSSISIWDMYGNVEIDFPLADGTFKRKPCKTMMGYSKVYMKTLGSEYRHIQEGKSIVLEKDVQIMIDVLSNRFYENVLGL